MERIFKSHDNKHVVAFQLARVVCLYPRMSVVLFSTIYVIMIIARYYGSFPVKLKILPRLQKKKPVDFDDELKIGDVSYDNMTKITIKVQLF